jgi:hypothetical protein
MPEGVLLCAVCKWLRTVPDDEQRESLRKVFSEAIKDGIDVVQVVMSANVSASEQIAEKLPKNSFTIKLQIPITTNDPEPMALLYAEPPSIDVYTAITKDVLRLLHGRGKAYFKARVSNGRIIIGREVENPGW